MAEGEPADCLMYMLTGRARVLSEGIQIGEIEVGAFFGESMFSHEATRSATVQTFDSTVVPSSLLKTMQSSSIDPPVLR